MKLFVSIKFVQANPEQIIIIYFLLNPLCEK